MPFVCDCGSEDFYTHGDEEIVWYVDGNGDIIEGGDIVGSTRTKNWPYICCECNAEYSQLPPANAEVEWIKKKKREYFDHTSRCPICDSSEITGDSIEPGDHHMYQDIHCNNCGAHWVDIYNLSGIEIQSYPDGYAPTPNNAAVSDEDGVPDPNDAFKGNI